MDILQYQYFYFVGLKGVAMTSLAQCLVDAGKTVRGSDVAEAFVTQEILDRLGLQIDLGFDAEIPAETQCVVYSSAHQAAANPQVLVARARQLPTLTQAEALASLFNQQKGIAVCGVGGKSTTSAMIAWILEKTGRTPSYSIGVGSIPGLPATGRWNPDAEFFVAEADEYVINPGSLARGEESIPRFSFLQPFVTVCTNLEFDHPDVYRDFAHTKQVFGKFFGQIHEGGALVFNSANLADLPELNVRSAVKTFGELPTDTLCLRNYVSQNGLTTGELMYEGRQYTLTLKLPGKFNVLNATSAVLASAVVGVPMAEAVAALESFRSTKRRAEFIGEKHGVSYYDDYAHHPHEVQKIIHAFREWYPQQRLIVLFQSHTFSRTKALFSEFVTAFAEADHVLMLDIFPSAREAYDDTVTSDGLCTAISEKFPQIIAENCHTLPALATRVQQLVQSGDVVLTVGAGDIYQLHDLIA